MNNFTESYSKILKTPQQIEYKMNFLNQKSKPKLSDIELTAVDLTSEYMGIDSETNFLDICLLIYRHALNGVSIIGENVDCSFNEKNYESS